MEYINEQYGQIIKLIMIWGLLVLVSSSYSVFIVLGIYNFEKQAGIEYGTHKRICQLHFNDGCFITNEENLDSKGKKKNILSLKKTAIPTTFNFGPPKTSRRLEREL